MKVYEFFNTMKKESLVHTAQEVGIKGCSRMKKADIAKTLADFTLTEEYMANLLIKQNDKEMKAFEELIRDGQADFSARNLRDFVYTGYVFVDKEKRKLVPCDEIPELFKRSYTDDVKERREKYQKVFCYCSMFMRLYGVISLDEAFEIYDRQNGDLSSEEFFALMDRLCYNSYDWELCDDLFVHSPLADFDEYNDLLDAQRGKPRYIPSKTKIMRYSDMDYVEETNEIRALFKFFEKDLGLEYDVADDLTTEIIFTAEDYSEPLEIFGIIDRYDIVFDSLQQAKKFTKLIQELLNNTRMPYNNGHTPNEIAELEYGRVSKPVIQFPTVSQSVQKQRKIGRNEPCPCGSGKKYKNCCGK